MLPNTSCNIAEQYLIRELALKSLRLIRMNIKRKGNKFIHTKGHKSPQITRIDYRLDLIYMSDLCQCDTFQMLPLNKHTSYGYPNFNLNFNVEVVAKYCMGGNLTQIEIWVKTNATQSKYIVKIYLSFDNMIIYALQYLEFSIKWQSSYQLL